MNFLNRFYIIVFIFGFGWNMTLHAQDTLTSTPDSISLPTLGDSITQVVFSDSLIRGALDSSKYLLALQLCKEELALHPEFHDVRLLKALAYMRLTYNDSARTELNYITSSQPGYREAWYLLGNLSYWEGDFASAVSYYNKGITETYNGPLLINKATSHFKLNQLKTSEQLADTVLAHEPKHEQALLLKDELKLKEADSLFIKKSFQKAIPIYRYYIKKYETHKDSRIKAGLSYQNLAKTDSAKFFFNSVLELDSEYFDANHLMLNISLGEKNYDKALIHLNRLLRAQPEDSLFLLRKAQILNEQGKYMESYVIADTLVSRNENDSVAVDLLYDVAPKAFPSTLTLSYKVDAFKEFAPWHLMYVQYAKRYDKDTYVGRINRMVKRKQVGLQIEGDYYRQMKDNSYLYANLGLSQDSLFPSLRVGAEYFHLFSKTFEGSLGFRHLGFDTNSVTIYTGSVGKYLNKLFIGYRHYAAKIDNVTYGTNVLSARVFGQHGNYFGVQYIYGQLHNENAWFSGSIYKLKANTFRVELFKKMNPLFSIQINGSLGTEEYRENLRRKRYSLEFMINRNF